MARLALCILALCAIGAYADPTPNKVEKLDIKVLQERQEELMELYFHVHEPNHIKKCQDIASSWSIEENVSHYANTTAAKTYVNMIKHKWYLPRAVPFSVSEPAHAFEALTLFNVLYSAKDYETFYKTAVYLRDIINEGLYVYVLNTVIVQRADTQGITIPLIYEVFPSYFNNGEIMTTAQRINVHGNKFVENYPSTYLWDNNVVIRWNATSWPYYDRNFVLTYFTHDYGLNTYNYHINLAYPYWLGSNVIPGFKRARRGEIWWFYHKQLLARYYMERLSNGLGEIPEITEVVEDGYNPGLLYHNGIPYPVRPNYYNLEQPHLSKEIEAVTEYERRLWESIDQGYIINRQGERINLLTPEGIDILGSVIEANADSPNPYYYKNFINLWKKILGNSVHHHYRYSNQFSPFVLPSVLEHPQSALRDPAFYMIWKRVLRLFTQWQKQMPLYKTEELSLPGVHIEQVEVDKLLTYFELTYMNVTNHLHMNDNELKNVYDDVSVLVQRPRLNHKPFNVKVHVKSEAAKTVVVKFFLGPKYDSNGYEIPLHLNTENFFMFDQFVYDLKSGENVITRESSANQFSSEDWLSTFDLYNKVINKQWSPANTTPQIMRYPSRLLLPKGRAGGMPFQIFVYISEYHEPKLPYGSGFDPQTSYGFSSGARYMIDDPIGFPMNRPIHWWQVENLTNLWFENVLIYHKHTPEIDVPHTE